MAVISCNIIAGEGRSGSHNPNEYRYVDIYRVITDNKNDGRDVVWAHPSLPTYGDAMTTGAGTPSDNAVVVGRDIELWNSDTIWKVTITYSTLLTGNTSSNPLTRPVDFKWNTNDGTESIFLAVDNTNNYTVPIVNSAGEPFETLPQRKYATKSLIITKNLSTYVGTSYEDSYFVNSDFFSIAATGDTFAPGTALLHISGADRLIENNFIYWRVTTVIDYKKRTWTEFVPDVGTYQLDETDETKLKPIVDKNGMPVTKPYPLDGAGFAQGSSKDDPAILTFKFYLEIPFSGLGLW